MDLMRTVNSKQNLVCTVHDHSFQAHLEDCFRCHDKFSSIYKSRAWQSRSLSSCRGKFKVQRVNISSFPSNTHEKYFQSSIGSPIILKLIQVQGRSTKNRMLPQFLPDETSVVENLCFARKSMSHSCFYMIKERALLLEDDVIF